MSEILVRVYRNNVVESVHRGHLLVVEGDGSQVARLGDPETVTFWRSAAKALQAIPMVMSGAADRFGFSEQEIALACASHSGESFHTALCGQMLAKTGFGEKDLRCGAHSPFHGPTAEAMIRSGAEPTQLENNCSGKHAGMLAFAKYIGADPAQYLAIDHPVQQAVLRTIVLFTGIPPGEIKLGTDGCSAPNFAVPISSMARAFSRLVNPGELKFEAEELEGPPPEVGLATACARIVAAQMRFPEYVGGSERLDTKIMRALAGKLVSKIGAEGVWSAGVLPSGKWKTGLGIALKIEDGDDGRARPAVAVELLRQLGLMTPEAEETLGEFSPKIIKNRMDIEVGHVAAEFTV